MKTTKVFAALMLASVVLVIICAIVSLTDTVAIVTGVVGSQEGSGISVIALLFGLIAVAMFAFAYKRAIWNWMIRTGMIVVGLIIFLASIAGLTENWNLRPGGGESFTWSAGGGEIVRTVYDSFLWIDFDVVHFLMLLGSFGILATAIWGAFRWEKAKSKERTEDQMRTVLDELPPAAFSPLTLQKFGILPYGKVHMWDQGSPSIATRSAPPVIRHVADRLSARAEGEGLNRAGKLQDIPLLRFQGTNLLGSGQTGSRQKRLAEK